MRFKLDIKLGNDSMQTGDDVGEALRDLAQLLQTQIGDSPLGEACACVRDYNGNTVGSWEVTAEGRLIAR